MYLVSDLVTSGLGVGGFGFAMGAWNGLRSAINVGRAAFLSLGMYMLFLAWLQYINFDGGWPADQPPDKEYHLKRTKADERRVSDAMESGGAMTDRDWGDYHRCLKVNVCVRRFARAPSRLGLSSPSVETGTRAPPITETRCVIMDGRLKCDEYIRR